MINVLVVDDEVSVRRSLGGILRKEGFKVSLARGGKEAIKKQQASPASVVLIDMRMPSIDGIKTATAIRAFDESVSLVGVTAFGSQYKPKANSLGFYDWIAKPVLSLKKKKSLVKIVKRAANHTAMYQLQTTVPRLISDANKGDTSGFYSEVRALNQRIDEVDLSNVLSNPYNRGITQVALLYTAALLLKESKIALDLFSEVFFSEVTNCVELIRQLREIRIISLAESYEKDMKSLESIVFGKEIDIDV